MNYQEPPVSQILHISDIHLSRLSVVQVTGDYKISGIIPLNEQQNRLELLRNSLRGLEAWLTARGIELDAIVVTGDVSFQFDVAGFDEFQRTLDCLGKRTLSPSRTLVVPGNHDVRWRTPPSSPQRYDLFVDRVRGAGYVTPLLEGIDIDPETGALIGKPPLPVVESADGHHLCIGVNSTNYCGSLRQLSDEAQAALNSARSAVAGTNAESELDSLVLHDVARVSPAQLVALRTVLQGFPSPAAGGPLRLGALHHQLLPVSPDEEFKTFENLTNLGQFRQFLVSQEFSVVLHGHKHQGLCYVDEVTLASEAGPRLNSYLVSSASTVWRHQGSEHEFARMVEVKANYPSARRVHVRSLGATSAGAEMSEPKAIRSWTVPLKSDRPSRPPFRARTANEVYARVMALFEDLGAGSTVHGLTCIVDDGASASQVPEQYPKLDAAEDTQEWLQDITEWWQRADPDLAGRGRRFNHGERIRKYVNGQEQIDAVVEALRKAPGTTRAIVQIIDPTRDQIRDVDQRIPSFVSCHFLLDPMSSKLHCYAYFRKQQMRMWWPVNVAEIAKLQAEVADKLRGGRDAVTAGSITTFAAVAIEGTDRPRVAVPRVDRIAQDRPEELWGVAHDLFGGRADVAVPQFASYFEDWQPTGHLEEDGSAISLRGLQVLQSAVALFADRARDDHGRRLATLLKTLHALNIGYIATEETTTQEASTRRLQYDNWAGQVTTHIADIKRVLDEMRRGAKG